MVIHTLLFLWFTIQTLIAAEQANNHFLTCLPVMVEHCYHDLGSETLDALCLVSKKAYQETVSGADRHYSIHDKELKNTACVKLICSSCFAENCLCESKKYRGLFCRTAPDKICHKVILDSSHTYTLLDLQNSMKQFKHLMQSQVFTAQMPTKRLPCDRHKNDSLPFSYDCISKPYFIKNTNSIGVLEGIPNISEKNFGIPNIYTIFELVCSNDGTCNRNTAYVLYTNDDKESALSLGFLTLFPVLFKKYITGIEQQACGANRGLGGEAVFFKNESLDKSYFSEANISQIIQLMQTITNVYSWLSRAHFDFATLDSYCHVNQPYPAGLLKKDRTNLVQFAYCAKSLGNEKLAIFFLKLYNRYEKNLLIAGPLTKESENKVSSDYNIVLEKLTSLSSIEEVITASKGKGSSAETALVQSNNNTFNFVQSLLHGMQPKNLLAGIWHLFYKPKNG